MSTNRVSPDAGWVDQAKLPRGPNGRALCRRCGVECPAGRRTFCSDACVHEWKLRTQPGYVRSLVLKRDRGVCAACGRDCWASGEWQADHITPVVEGGGECGIENYRTLCTACHKLATKELHGRLSAKRREAKTEPLKRPLRFGDAEQIAAKRYA